MQKLTQNTSLGMGNNQGSALVTAVALALIMAIAGIGFILVTTHSLNNDSDAYTRDKAFYAAESGALLGAKYIMARAMANWPTNGTLPDSLKKISINGLYVKNTINNSPGGNANQIEIVSEVFTSNTAQNAATFVKRERIRIQN
jgi:hypothetical protein